MDIVIVMKHSGLHSWLHSGLHSKLKVRESRTWFVEKVGVMNSCGHMRMEKNEAECS